MLTKITHRTLIPLAALAALVTGCDAPESAPNILPSPDASAPMVEAQPLRLTLLDRTSGLIDTPPGPFRLIAEETRGQARIERALADRIDAWPHTVEIDPLPPGTWRLTVFADRGDDGHFDGCPFPPEPSHAERADTLDNISGVVEVQSGRALEVAVPMLRRICGPGDVDTGLAGALIRPDDPALDGVPIRAVLTPDEALARMPQGADLEGAPRSQALRFPLFPDGSPVGESDFHIGELVPGRYRLQLFADHDGDGAPSPCLDGAPGGGDRFVSRVVEVEVSADVITPLDAPFTLEAAACPAELTGVIGQIRLPGDMAIPEGALRVEVSPTEGGAPIASAAIAETLRGRALPHPFTISGLPAGMWRVRLYFDLDADRRFSPCAGMPSTVGFDHVSATLDDVRIEAGALLDLGAIDLADAGCAPSAGIAGTAEVEVEDGPLSSARAVRLHLEPLGGGEPVALQLFSDHVGRDGTGGRFGRRIPSGRYRAVAYVDTDRDGTSNPCTEAPYGDRAQSEPFPVEVGPEEIIELPPVRVADLGCPVPDAGLAPVLHLGALPSDGRRPDTLLVDIREEGGWFEQRAFDIGVDDDLSVDRIALVPGQYTVTAYVDGDDDGALDSCGESVPDPYQASVSLTLDAAQPLGRPPLRPSPCDH